MDPYERPAWAATEVVGADGGTVLLDAQGRRLTAIAFTAEELGVLRAVLRAAPQDEAVRALLTRLQDD